MLSGWLTIPGHGLCGNVAPFHDSWRSTSHDHICTKLESPCHGHWSSHSVAVSHGKCKGLHAFHACRRRGLFYLGAHPPVVCLRYTFILCRCSTSRRWRSTTSAMMCSWPRPVAPMWTNTASTLSQARLEFESLFHRFVLLKNMRPPAVKNVPRLQRMVSNRSPTATLTIL